VSDSTNQDPVHITVSPLITLNHLITAEVSLSIKLVSVDSCDFSFRSFVALYVDGLETPVSCARCFERF
jgi:hypothetical protein